jgi:phage terminase large subunit
VLHAALDAHRWSVAVCHRRFGKTVLAINHLQKAATKCTKREPRFAYIAPTYKMAKRIAWDYLVHYARPIPGADPNISELRMDYPNGGRVSLYGADNPDALRGIYLDGVVLDEYGLMSEELWGEVIRPLLSDRQGWAFFIGTPNGKNQFYEKVKEAQATPGWFFAEYKASQTGILSAEELASARQTMTDDQYQQEYECSFDASVKGAIFAREMRQAFEDGRVTSVPYEPMLPVDTYWDLGVDDFMTIWFGQSSQGGEFRAIDYYENSGHGLQHYWSVLKEKPYAYGTHYAPHDIKVRELTSGRSRIEAAASLGLSFVVAPKMSIEDGINAARMLLPKCWFDAAKTAQGVEALKHYQWKPIDVKFPTSAPLPVHNWASHGADAFRTAAVCYFQPRQRRERDKPDIDRYDIRTQNGGYYVPAHTTRGQYGQGPRGGY